MLWAIDDVGLSVGLMRLVVGLGVARFEADVCEVAGWGDIGETTRVKRKMRSEGHHGGPRDWGTGGRIVPRIIWPIPHAGQVRKALPKSAVRRLSVVRGVVSEASAVGSGVGVGRGAAASRRAWTRRPFT